MMNIKTKQSINKINKILICGLGGIGCVCASKIFDSKSAELKILLDKERLTKYLQEKTTFNSKQYDFEYILPEDNNFTADLIIIATKADGLNQAVKNVKNFTDNNTLFISLLNGIHSEEEIKKYYPANTVITSFFLGHSCIRNGRNITQDGIYKIVMGSDNTLELNKIADFFDCSGINYEIPNNIQEEYWKKFLINTGINQLSAVTGLTLKDIKKNEALSLRLKKLMYEASLIAEKEGIKSYKKIYENAVKFLFEEIKDATPSMLQDIMAKRKTEVEIFSGEIIKLGKKHNINTPENLKIFTQIKSLES